MAASLVLATCAAPTNIAAVKYWGKRDAALNTPLNSSVSVTLHQADLRTVTTAAASPAFAETQLWLNGEPQPLNARVRTVLREMQALARQQHGESGAHAWHLRIVSENSFPTAAGLASSAAGYACLVAALAELYRVRDAVSPEQLSTIARQGSGSACRSLFGGFVRWEKGSRADGADSRAVQVADEHHWPALRAIICVVNDKEKDTSSTSGMQTSKATSELLAYRASAVVEGRLAAIERAYLARDFESFGKITMQDSNQFHAVCLDTYPPISYLNETSRKIIHLVHRYNAFHGHVRAAYTFDAGPNAVIFVQEPHMAEVVALLDFYFPKADGTRSGGGGRKLPLPIKTSSDFARAGLPAAPLRDAVALTPSANAVKMLYLTRVGSGPHVLPQDQSLVDPTSGAPRLREKKNTDATLSARNNVTRTMLASLAVSVLALHFVRR